LGGRTPRIVDLPIEKQLRDTEVVTADEVSFLNILSSQPNDF